MILLLKKYWYIVAIILLISALAKMNRMRIEEKIEKERVTSNFDNLSNESLEKDRQFTLKKSEWENWNDKVKEKIDSLERANDILHKRVKSVMVVNTTYKDTSPTEVTHGKPVQETPSDTTKQLSVPYYDIAVGVNEYCWGMKGVIRTTDPNAKLTITEKTANNSIQKIEISNRFLGFLWMTKKSKFKVFTDCGESTITNIELKK